ncbi:MAG: hypothetical protein R2911_05255 [Caldilineaceae bacterium]
MTVQQEYHVDLTTNGSGSAETEASPQGVYPEYVWPQQLDQYDAHPAHILQRLDAHDRYQLELKLDYELIEGQQTRYEVQTYFFVPRALGISADTYTRSEFFRDLQNHIRLKTPEFALPDLLHSAESPLRRLEQIVQADDWPDAHYADALITSFKFLRATLKSTLREHWRPFASYNGAATQHLPSINYALKLPAAIEQFLYVTTELSRRFHQLYPALAAANLHSDVLQAYGLTDESISLLIEENLLGAYELTSDRLASGQRDGLRQALRTAIQRETQHRQKHGAGSVLRRNGKNEEFLYRSSVLKKFTSSVLFLSTAVEREGVTQEHVLYALAAGISMIFATVIAFYAQRVYGNFTTPLFVALVVGYMFKDRIKELGRAFFARSLHNRLYDRRIVVKTLDGEHEIGYIREKVRFVSEQAAPPAVLKARNRQLLSDIANDGQGEQVICYAKEVVLFKDIFRKLYGESPPIRGLNDIMRYDVHQLLRKMANPPEQIHARWRRTQDGALPQGLSRQYCVGLPCAHTHPRRSDHQNPPGPRPQRHQARRATAGLTFAHSAHFFYNGVKKHVLRQR